MKISKCAVILWCIASNIAYVDASETIEIKIGRDWYYRSCCDGYIVIEDPIREGVEIKPYEHAPKVPDGFRSRTEYTLRGMPFEPREFWEKPINEQLLFLKDVVLGCDLLSMIDEHHDGHCFYALRYSKQPAGKPYPAALELQFEKAVWETLSKKYDISFESFTASLRSMLIPEDTLYSAPLIVYFADKLAPRYEFHYKGINEWDRVLMKVLKRSSEFEVLIGTPDVGTVVYEKK